MFANREHEEAHELLKEGKINEAIELYSQALEESPDNVNILSDRGVAYLHQMNKEMCFRDLNKAIELQPDYGFRYAARAYAKNNFGDLLGAIVDYEKAVELDPDDAIAHNNLGMLLEKQGYKQEAEKRFERADKLSKMEDHLLEVMDNLEGNPSEDMPPKKEEERHEIDPTIQREKTLTARQEFKKVFTSRAQFREFLDFLKNGLNIK